MARIFISYRREKLPEVQKLVEDIEELSGHRVWFDKVQVGNRPWWDEVLAEIQSCDVMMVIYDRLLDTSYTCSRELSYAISLNKPIIPILLPDVDSSEFSPRYSHRYNYLAYEINKTDSYKSLARRLKGITEAPSLVELYPEAPAYPSQEILGLWRRITRKRLFARNSVKQNLRKLEVLRKEYLTDDDYEFLKSELIAPTSPPARLYSVFKIAGGLALTGVFALVLLKLPGQTLFPIVTEVGQPDSIDITLKAKIVNVEREEKLFTSEAHGVSTGSLVSEECQTFTVVPDAGWDFDSDSVRLIDRVQQGQSSYAISKNDNHVSVEFCALSKIVGIRKYTGDSFGKIQFLQYRSSSTETEETKKVAIIKPEKDVLVKFSQAPQSIIGEITTDLDGSTSINGVGTFGSFVVESVSPDSFSVRWIGDADTK